MDKASLKELWRRTFAAPSKAGLNDVARSVVDIYDSEAQFREHIKNRSKRVTERTGVKFDPKEFGIESARAYVADEIGFTSWNELISAVEGHGEKSILFCYAIAAMDRGDFTALEEAIGPENFLGQIADWHEKGYFGNESETLDEIFAAACMLGQTETAAYLLDKGVDPYAGMKTGLSGFHYAASSGRLEVIKLLVERGVPMEVKNIYGGTVFGQAIWSAIHENRPDHAAIVEALIGAGALVDEGYPEWWEEQDVPDVTTKLKIKQSLQRWSKPQKASSNKGK